MDSITNTAGVRREPIGRISGRRSLNALRENRSRIVPGRMNRIMNALVPASVKRTMTAKMLGKTLANKPTPASARAQA